MSTVAKLIASLPAKRFDHSRHLCIDGRGGWLRSQVNVDRSATSLEDYLLVFCLGVLATDAVEDDYVESTRLSATMDGQPIGEDTLDWVRPNPMWSCVDGKAVFEWPQWLVTNPPGDGLITVAIDVKLHSQEGWLPVEGNAYCRVRLVKPITQQERRFVSGWGCTLRGLLPERRRRS